MPHSAKYPKNIKQYPSNKAFMAKLTEAFVSHKHKQLYLQVGSDTENN